MESMSKITIRQYNEFRALVDKGQFEYQRYGQAFMSHFGILDLSWEEVTDHHGDLWNAETRAQAEDIIWRNYIDLGERPA